MTTPRKRRQRVLVLAATAWVAASTSLFAEELANEARKQEAAARTKSDQAFVAENKESVEAAQLRLERVLQQRIATIDRVCQLDEAQRKRLELAGRLAIKRLFDRLQEQAEDRDEGPEAGILRSMLRSGPFQDDSLFGKALRGVLTPEQAHRLDERARLAASSNKPIAPSNLDDLVRISRLPKDVFRIAWNRDGKQIAFTAFNQHVEIFLSPADQPVRVIGDGRKVVDFDFGPRDDLVALGTNSRMAFLIDLAQGAEVALATDQPQPNVKFSPDGKTLATGGYGTKAKLWSAATGELVREFDVGPTAGGLTPVFSPDGTVLAVGHRNHTTRLFAVATGELLHTLPKPQSHGLSFDPTGQILAVSYVDGHVALWDVPTGTLKKRVRAWAEELYDVNWSPDGSLLVTAGLNSQVTLWNPSDLTLLREVESPEWIIRAGFSPDGTKLIFAGGGRTRDAHHWVELWAVP